MQYSFYVPEAAIRHLLKVTLIGKGFEVYPKDFLVYPADFDASTPDSKPQTLPGPPKPREPRGTKDQHLKLTAHAAIFRPSTLRSLAPDAPYAPNGLLTAYCLLLTLPTSTPSPTPPSGPSAEAPAKAEGRAQLL